MMEVKTKRVFKIVFILQLIDLLAFTLILPLLPKLLEYYAKNDSSGLYKSFESLFTKIFSQFIHTPVDAQNQVLLAGLLGSWFSLLQFVSSPIVGSLSDKFGRKPMMLATMVGSLISYGIWFCSYENFGLFVLSRTIGGLSKATVGLSLAIIGDVSDENSRGKGMALIGSSFSLAFIVGPCLGAYLSTMANNQHYPTQLIANPSAIAILLTLFNLIFIWKCLNETNSKKLTKKELITEDISRSNNHKAKTTTFDANNCRRSSALDYINPRSLFTFELVKHDSKKEAFILQKTGLIYFQYLLFYSGLEFTLSFLTHNRFQFSPIDQGKLYLFSGLLMALVQGGIVRRLRSGKESLYAFIGLMAIIPAFILMGLSTQVSHIYYSLTLYAISSAVVVPCLTTVVSLHSPTESKGAVMGTLRSLGALARAIGPCMASLIYWTLGSTLCYLLGAIALCWPLYLMKKLYSVLSFQKSVNLNDNYSINKTANIRNSLAKAH